MMDSGHAIVWTRVSHERKVEPHYRFRYRLFSLLLDLDRLPELNARSRWLKFNRAGLFSFHEADHGARDGTPLRPWLEQGLRLHGIELNGGRVRLFCLPRVLGYGFNPISVWYCENSDGDMVAVLCEVHNTFGEQHSYLLHDKGNAMTMPLRQRRPKRFHVSPFFDVDGEYRFSLGAPAERLSVVVELLHSGRPSLVAYQAGTVGPLEDRALVNAFFRIPLATFKVMAAIHWQALRIWLRGATFHSKPHPPQEEIS